MTSQYKIGSHANRIKEMMHDLVIVTSQRCYKIGSGGGRERNKEMHSNNNRMRKRWRVGRDK